MSDAAASPPADDGWEWSIVEVFGKRRHAGRAREEDRFGAKGVRVDIPIDGDPAKGWETRLYGGAPATIDADQIAFIEQQLRDTASDRDVFLKYIGAGSVEAMTVPQYQKALTAFASKKKGAGK